MIRLIQEGKYRLSESKRQTKLLILDEEKTFAWINAVDIGEILVASQKDHLEECVLSIGRYRLYKVKDEPKLTDLIHLELHVGNGRWQGYLLPTGLPTDIKRRNRIIPTNETISQPPPVITTE